MCMGDCQEYIKVATDMEVLSIQISISCSSPVKAAERGQDLYRVNAMNWVRISPQFVKHACSLACKAGVIVEYTCIK